MRRARGAGTPSWRPAAATGRCGSGTPGRPARRWPPSSPPARMRRAERPRLCQVSALLHALLPTNTVTSASLAMITMSGARRLVRGLRQRLRRARALPAGRLRQRRPEALRPPHQHVWLHIFCHWHILQMSAAAHSVRPVLARVEDACRVRWETTLQKGVCGVAFDRQDIAMNKFAAACLESHCLFFDARTQHPKTGDS